MFTVFVSHWPRYDEPIVTEFDTREDAIAYAKDQLRKPYTPVKIECDGIVLRDW